MVYRTLGPNAVIPEGLGGFDNYGWTITVDGVDITSYVDITSVKITNALSNRVDMLDFTIEDDTGELFVADQAEVIILDAQSNKIFGGWISNPKFNQEGLTNIWQVEAQEYGCLLDQRIVNRIYQSLPDFTVVGDASQGLVPLYTPEFTIDADYVSDIDAVQFPRQTLREALQKITDITGAHFWVDYEKVFHYKKTAGANAPFAISDNPDYSTSFPCADWEYSRDSTQLKNRVIVHGGTYLSAPFVENFTGDGTTTVFTTKHDKPKPFSVTVSGVSLAVGVASLNKFSDGYTVLVDDANKEWQFQSAPASGAPIVITYQYQAPIQVQVISQASYLKFGRYYDDFINDQGLLSEQAAIDRGTNDINQYAFPREIANCKVYQPGLKAGMVVSVTDGHTRDSDGNPLAAKPMLVQSVTTTGLSGGYFEYALELGNYNVDLMMQVVGISLESQRTTMTQDFLSEFATVSDSTTATDSPTATPHTGGYTWGNDMRWGFFQWG